MINPSSRNFVLWYWGLALGYFGTGYLLSNFLVQSQVVSVWLPAGIALFGAYIWNWRFVPAVFVASMLFNLSNHELAHISPDVWREVFVIASGASLQAISGGLILRKWLGNPLDSHSDYKSLAFIVVVGLLVNLISSNIGVLALSLYSMEYSPERHWYNVLNWWMGDSLGVLLATPLLFCLHNLTRKPHQVKKARGAIMLTTLILFLSATMTSHYLSSSSQTATRSMVGHELKLIENSLYREINKSLAHIQTLATYLQNTPGLSMEDFEHFAQGLMNEQSAIKGMSWNPVIAADEIPEFEKMLSALYVDQKQVRGMPLELGDHLVVVKYITPLSGNEAAVGYNVYSDPGRKSVLSSPDSTFKPIATPIIQLVQSESKEPGFLLFAPVFAAQERNVYATAHQPQPRLIGYAVGVFLVQQMLDVAMDNVPPGLFLWEIAQKGSKQAFLSNTGTRDIILNNDDKLESIEVNMAGQTWEMHLAPRSNFLLHYQEKSTRIMMVLQFTVISFLMLFMFVFNNRRAALDLMVMERTRELEDARRHSELASEAKSRFLANMSHEIRTPLNAVIGFSSLVKHSSDPNEIALYLQKIELSSRSLLNIVNDILDISKIEADKLILENIPFDLNQILHQIQVMFESSAAQKGLEWTVHSDVSRSCWYKGDPTRLEQILINLCGNAFKFTSEGEVTLHVTELEADGNVSVIEFVILDTGIGISELNQESLFEAFNQADTSTSRRFGGTGLGLSISRQLARLMNGNITVRSVEGVGSEFRVTCRFEQTEAQALPEVRKVTRDLQGLRVLVAEDNMVNQMMIQAILNRAGVEPVLASNGQEACDYVRTMKFDVVLMDFQMPVMDGYEATRQIRTVYPATVLPIIALTADAMPEDKIKAIECGCNDHMAKPIEVDKLLQVLGEIAAGKQQLEKWQGQLNEH